MNFGEAIELLKAGKKVAREGWNGKGMFIYLVKGSVIPLSNLRNEAKEQYVAPEQVTDEIAVIKMVAINSHIDMLAADGSIVIGWLASQTDMLAEDWVEVQ